MLTASSDIGSAFGGLFPLPCFFKDFIFVLRASLVRQKALVSVRIILSGYMCLLSLRSKLLTMFLNLMAHIVPHFPYVPKEQNLQHTHQVAQPRSLELDDAPLLLTRIFQIFYCPRIFF